MIIDEFFTFDYLHSTFERDGAENVKTGTSDIFRVNLQNIVQQIVKHQSDITSSISNIQGKFFLFAHHIWLNNHKNKLFSFTSLLENEHVNSFLTRRKAYTITSLPRFLVFNLEYGEYFNYSTPGVESNNSDFRRYFH